MYMSDWLPTLYSAAGEQTLFIYRISYDVCTLEIWWRNRGFVQGLDPEDLGKIDGVNMWSALRGDKPSPRSEIVINIDDISNYAAIRRGDFKYVIGTTDTGDAWYGETGRPELDNNGGTLSTYDAEVILQSKAGVALAGAITARQVEEVRKMREGKSPGGHITTRMLTAPEIHSLRTNAVLNCNVKEEDKVIRTTVGRFLDV